MVVLDDAQQMEAKLEDLREIKRDMLEAKVLGLEGEGEECMHARINEPKCMQVCSLKGTSSLANKYPPKSDLLGDTAVQL